jgi:hypothetical protein
MQDAVATRGVRASQGSLPVARAQLVASHVPRVSLCCSERCRISRRSSSSRRRKLMRVKNGWRQEAVSVYHGVRLNLRPANAVLVCEWNAVQSSHPWLPRRLGLVFIGLVFIDPLRWEDFRPAYHSDVLDRRFHRNERLSTERPR